MSKSLPFRAGSILDAYVKFAGVVLLVAAGLVGFHAYIESRLPFAQVLHSLYSADFNRGPDSRIWPFFDFFLPLVCLIPAATALFGGKRFLHTLIATGLFSAVLVGLLPVYAIVLPPAPLVWWPQGAADVAVLYLAGMFAKNFCLVGLFMGVLWLLAPREAKDKTKDAAPTPPSQE